MTEELKPCHKCGGRAIFVDKYGMYSHEVTNSVSCEDIKCMPVNEFYTLNEWQSGIPADPSLEEDDTCPECGGCGEVGDPGGIITACERCNGKGTI